MLAILCLEYDLNDSLSHRNPRNAWEWKNFAQTLEFMFTPHSMTNAKYNSRGSGISYVEQLLEGSDYNEFNITRLMPSLIVYVYAQTLALLLSFFLCLLWLLMWGIVIRGTYSRWPIDPPHIHWTIYTYDPYGFAWERVIPLNPNVMGYPFPPNTQAVSFFFPLFFLFLLFLFLSYSLTLLSSNCSPLSKSMRSWYGWPGTFCWRWPTTRGICIVLEEWPTQALVMMMMMVRRRTWRLLLVTNQGRGGTVDYLQS